MLWEASRLLEPGQNFAKYRVVEFLGSGVHREVAEYFDVRADVGSNELNIPRALRKTAAPPLIPVSISHRVFPGTGR